MGILYEIPLIRTMTKNGYDFSVGVIQGYFAKVYSQIACRLCVITPEKEKDFENLLAKSQITGEETIPTMIYDFRHFLSLAIDDMLFNDSWLYGFKIIAMTCGGAFAAPLIHPSCTRGSGATENTIFIDKTFYDALSDDAKQFIILHELAHFKNNDKMRGLQVNVGVETRADTFAFCSLYGSENVTREKIMAIYNNFVEASADYGADAYMAILQDRDIISPVVRKIVSKPKDKEELKNVIKKGLIKILAKRANRVCNNLNLKDGFEFKVNKCQQLEIVKVNKAAKVMKVVGITAVGIGAIGGAVVAIKKLSD